MRLWGAIVVALGGLAAIGAAAGGCGGDEQVDCGAACADAGADAPGPGAEEGGGRLEDAIAPVELATIGGSVAGLLGSGLILQDNGTDDLQIGMNGPFVFPTKVRNGNGYAVTVSSQPSNPTQTCSVAGGAGTVKGANVTDVSVTCSTSAYTVGGTVVGLGGATGLVLSNNGVDDLPIVAGGAFTFATKVASGSTFAVAVKKQPTGGGPCTVSGETGNVQVGGVSSVVVNCTPGTYTIGGTVTGLVGTVVVQQNGGSDLVLNATGSFAFPQPLADLSDYAVTVQTQPAYPPRSQTCTVTKGAGKVAGANVTSVAIACATDSFTVGGSISGLAGTVVLKNKGADSLTRMTNGAFTFATPVLSGSTYAVTVGTQPSGQTCTVTGGSGTLTNAAVADVAITCAATTGPSSCQGLPATCGGARSCCTSNSVAGGTFNRSNDGTYPATVTTFKLDVFEVTVGRFRTFVNAGKGTQASPPAAGAGAHPTVAASGWNATWNASLPATTAALKTALACDAAYPAWTDAAGANETRAMNCLSWFEAFAFCAWDGARLPTEAEWNYAAAGGSEQRIHAWGATIDQTKAAYDCGGAGPGNCTFANLKPVGSFSPQGDGKWGQADLTGNVWEYTLDYSAVPYRLLACADCADLQPAMYRTFRGGSFANDRDYQGTAVRLERSPGIADYDVGVRCAR